MLFKRDALTLFNQLSATPLEHAESCDMLRVLEHGFSIKAQMSDQPFYAVDVPEDVYSVEAALNNQDKKELA